MAVAAPPEKALPNVPLPRNAASSWALHKFGGASLATPELYKQCSDLLIDESRKQKDEIGSCVPTMAIVSARGGVTDRLIQVVEAALDDIDAAASLLEAVLSEQIDAVRILAGDDVADEVGAQMKIDAESLIAVMRAVSLLRTIPPSTMEVVTGFGEVWSAMTMQAYLRTRDVPTAWIDARDVLIVEQTAGGGLGALGSSDTVGTYSHRPDLSVTVTLMQVTRARAIRSAPTRCGTSRRSGSGNGLRSRSTRTCSRRTVGRAPLSWW